MSGRAIFARRTARATSSRAPASSSSRSATRFSGDHGADATHVIAQGPVTEDRLRHGSYGEVGVARAAAEEERDLFRASTDGALELHGLLVGIRQRVRLGDALDHRHT